MKTYGPKTSKAVLLTLLDERVALCDDLTARLQALRDSLHERFLSWRGVDPENACPKCDGSGVRAYGSTATWRGGIGGQAITTGVCDGCWGSGDKTRPGVNLRALPAKP